MAERHPSARKGGFTLLDLLLTIGIIGVLVGLALPMVGQTRDRAIDATSMANMRTHAQVVQLYADDFRGMAPFVADPDATYSIARGGGLTVSFEFFEAVELWGIALVDRYYGFGLGNDQWDEQLDFGIFARPAPDGFMYQYSPTFFTRPEYWDQNTRDTRHTGQLRPVRIANVANPGSKAVFLEGDGERGFPVWGTRGLLRDEKWAFAFADGSVRRPAANQLAEPCPLGEGNAHGGRFSVGVVGLHTKDGILGRDVE